MMASEEQVAEAMAQQAQARPKLNVLSPRTTAPVKRAVINTEVGLFSEHALQR